MLYYHFIGIIVMNLNESSPKINISTVVFLLIAILALSLSNKAFSVEFRPYIGVDKQLNTMRFKDGYGENLFPKRYMQANIYSGLSIDDSFKVEVGYISTKGKIKDSNLKTNDDCLGAKVPLELSPAIFKSQIKVTGHHLSFISIYSRSEWSRARILFGAGAAFLKVEADRNSLALSRPPVCGNFRKFKKQKVVLRLMVAPEYRFKNNIGIRSSVCFLRTSRILMVAEPLKGAYTPIIRPKDSFVYSLGIFFEF